MKRAEGRIPRRWWLLLVVSLGVMTPFAAPYLTLDPERSRVTIDSVAIQYPLLVAHVGLALAALAAGFPQFLAGLREARPRLHRITGRIYAGCVFASGILAVPLAFYEPDYTRAASFLALAAAWLFTTGHGWRTALCGDWEAHNRWMTRSFGVTLAAVSARLLVPLLLLLYLALHGFSLPGGREDMIKEVLAVNIWAGLLVNLMLVEWYVLGKRRKKG
ncbi:DUF2306 domain-containing protein [Paenibacillus sp. CC-CFT747]|nr:DUF2306 domain-containing protein [Paenibacillus sp. CC-CFT747]